MEPVGASGDVWWRGGLRRWAQGAGEAASGEFVHVNWYHVEKLLREFTVAIMSDPVGPVHGPHGSLRIGALFCFNKLGLKNDFFSEKWAYEGSECDSSRCT